MSFVKEIIVIKIRKNNIKNSKNYETMVLKICERGTSIVQAIVL